MPITSGGHGGSVREPEIAGPHATMGAVTAPERVVVVVEDDLHIADLVELYLRQAGYRVYQATDGETGLRLVGQHRADLVVLDVGLPGPLDGFAVCRRLRESGDIPIVMLTARDSEIDRVLGLELGADDYVTKPFSPRELVARVRGILRRAEVGPRPAPSVITVGDIEIDLGRWEARVGGRPVPLAAKELALLVYLAEHRGLALSRRQLVGGVWGHDWVGDERTVDVHVRQLRRKLGDGLPLTTVWGIGYRLE
jgi:two-component system response regulator MtrA